MNTRPTTELAYCLWREQRDARENLHYLEARATSSLPASRLKKEVGCDLTMKEPMIFIWTGSTNV